MVCKIHNITEGSIEIALDGKAAMETIFDEKAPKSEAPCFDMMMDIRRKLEALPIKVTGRHIKGHQDKHASFQCLNRWSQLNVRMDSRAKNLLRQRLSQGHQSVPTPFGNDLLPVFFVVSSCPKWTRRVFMRRSMGKRP